MVASVLVVIGIVGSIQGLSALTRGQTYLQEQERMQRLAVSKYDEMIATGLTNAATSGDFQDYSEPRYRWEADIRDTGTENLQSLRVTVTPAIRSNNQASVEGLVFTAPAATDAGTTGGNP